MILECNNCGAPLDVKDGSRRAKCNYCGQTSYAEKLGKVSEQTPPGWVPPQQWTPPAHSQLAGRSLVYKPVRLIGRLISLGITFGILATFGSVALHVTRAVNQATNAHSAELQGAINQAIGAMTQKINEAAQANGTSGDGPVTCGGIDKVTVTGKTLRVEGTSGAPVTAAGNCRVTLVACKLSGPNAVIARDNAHVSVEGGSLTGVKAAVALSGNAALDVSGGTMLTGAPAVTTAGNSRATLRDASVNGAVDTHDNASVDAVGAKLLGPVTGTRRVRK